MKVKKNGFTLIEALVVLAMAAIMLAIALPSVFKWREQAAFKEAARQVVTAMREARSLAVAQQWEYRVDFDVDGGRYQITRGDRANGSANWDTVVTPWTPFHASVTLRSGSTCTSLSDTSLRFSPDGTAGCFGAPCWDANRFLCVLDGAQKKFLISVTSPATGHTEISRWDGTAWAR